MITNQTLESTVCGVKLRRWSIGCVKRLEFAKQRLAGAPIHADGRIS
jgi:hypothetical protein